MHCRASYTRERAGRGTNKVFVILHTDRCTAGTRRCRVRFGFLQKRNYTRGVFHTKFVFPFTAIRASRGFF